MQNDYIWRSITYPWIPEKKDNSGLSHLCLLINLLGILCVEIDNSLYAQKESHYVTHQWPMNSPECKWRLIRSQIRLCLDSVLTVFTLCILGDGSRPGEVCRGAVSTCDPAVKCVWVSIRVCVQKQQADTRIPEKHSGGERREDHHQQTRVRRRHFGLNETLRSPWILYDVTVVMRRQFEGHRGLKVFRQSQKLWIIYQHIKSIDSEK